MAWSSLLCFKGREIRESGVFSSFNRYIVKKSPSFAAWACLAQAFKVILCLIHRKLGITLILPWCPGIPRKTTMEGSKWFCSNSRTFSFDNENPNRTFVSFLTFWAFINRVFFILEYFKRKKPTQKMLFLNTDSIADLVS